MSTLKGFMSETFDKFEQRMMNLGGSMNKHNPIEDHAAADKEKEDL